MGKTISEAGNMLQVQQQQKQAQAHNALMGIFKDPSSLDETGNPTKDTLQKATAIDPQFGLSLRQSSMINQDRQIRLKYFLSDQAAKNSDRISEAYAPVVERREDKIAKGMPAAQADREAQEEIRIANESLAKGGMDPELMKLAPQGWDPVKVPMLVQNSQGFRDWQKQQLAAQKEAREAHRAANTGATQITLPNGRVAVFRPNAEDPTKQYTFAGTDETVPADQLQGVTKVGTGAGAPAAAKEKDAALIGAMKAKQDRGEQLTPDETRQVDEAKHRVDARIDPGVEAATRKQAATSKAADVVVDGTKHQQAIWKYGQWFEPDGVTPIKGAVQGAGTARADQTLADREKHAEEMKDAGVPETPDQKAATAAQVATGEPMTQIIPGWGPASRKAQNEARSAAIQLIRDQTGMDPIDAGIELANRGIEYASGKKAQGIQQTMLSTTRTAVKQLDYNIDKVKEELTRLKSTNVSPVINAIMRKEQEWTGDPNLSSLFYSMSAVGMESARILSGGSASIQQLHEGAANEARRWANIGMTPASFESVSRTISEEGRARLKAWEDGIKEGRIGGQPKTGNTAPGAAQGGQPAFQPTDVDFLRKNPDKAALFDKRFGEGASKRALATPAQAAAPQAGFAPLTPNAAAPTVAQPTAAAAPAAKPQPGARPVPTELAQHADGVMTSQSTGQRWQKTGDQMWPIPEPMPSKEDGLKNGMIYQTKRGPARWDSEKKQFFTVGGS